MQYELEEFEIIKLKLCRLKDEEGEYWYPLSNFLSAILFRKTKSSKYRDDERYNKFMKVIPYTNPKSLSKETEQKTWFINQEGMYRILSDIKIYTRNRPSDVVREKYLATARAFMGVTTVQNSGLYLNYRPSLDGYDVWSATCIENDPYITKQTLWRKCSGCGFYYPETKRYFFDGKARKCFQCTGRRFICKNNRLNYIYKHDGIDLLYALHEKSDEEIIKEFKLWVRQGGVF